MKKKVLSIILALVMVAGMVPFGAITAFAAEGVKYLEYNTATGEFDELTCTDYTPLADGVTTWSGGWYVAPEGKLELGGVNVNGSAYLILTDGCELIVNGGIHINNGSSFTIYAQSEGENAGILKATGNEDSAGIGSGYRGSCGNITINGGNVTATGGSSAAGIGNGRYGSCGNITINGGKVRAKCGDPDQYGNAGAGIGNAYYGSCGDITINGGEITAIGCDSSVGDGGNGIGNAYKSTCGKVIINGGYITAVGGKPFDAEVVLGEHISVFDRVNAKMIVTDNTGEKNYCDTFNSLAVKDKNGRPVSIIFALENELPDNAVKYYEFYDEFGIVIANYKYIDFDSASPILSETRSLTSGWYKVDGEVTIDASLTVTGDVHLILLDGCKLTVSYGVLLEKENSLSVYAGAKGTGQLIATGNYCADNHSAGIGGNNNDAGDLTIYGGNVTATGVNNAAGIGGGAYGAGGTVTIFGGSVTATGRNHGAGIGGGEYGAGGTVNIFGGSVTATGGVRGAGIGGGYFGNGGTVTVYGGSVTATGGEKGAGIGGGYNGNGGTVTVYGGNINAVGGTSAAGIGGGTNNSGADINISGGSVIAVGGEGCSAVGHGVITSSVGTVNSGEISPFANAVLYNGRDDSVINGKLISLNNRHYTSYIGPVNDTAVKDEQGRDKVCFYAISDTSKQTRYLEYNTDTKKCENKSIDEGRAFGIHGSTTWDMPWYEVDGNEVIDSKITVNGDVNLILKDGCKLEANGGITVTEGSSLTVYGQSIGTGELIAKSTDIHYAAIEVGEGAAMTVHGGKITATGGSAAAGIGGGYESNGGNIAVYGGAVIAVSGQNAGIGGGSGCTSHGELTLTDDLIIIAGDTSDDSRFVTAAEYKERRSHYVFMHLHNFTGGTCAYCGKGPITYIDHSWDETKKQVITTEKAISDDAPKITADTTELSGGWYVADGEVTVTEKITVSGNVNLILKDGCSLMLNKGLQIYKNGSLTIYGQAEGTGTLKTPQLSENMTAIGVGENTVLTVHGVNIYAYGGKYAAAIGGNYQSSNNVGNVTVYGGNIYAYGGEHGSGIGGDHGSATGGVLNVYGNCYISAEGGNKGINSAITLYPSGAGSKAKGIRVIKNVTEIEGSPFTNKTEISDPLNATKVLITPLEIRWTSTTALPTDGGYYVLENDVTLSNGWNVLRNTAITLDLNGHTLKRNLTEATENGYVISTSGNLTILDSSTGKTGKITGGKNTGNGGGIFVGGGTLTMNDVTLSGNSAINGGGIYVEQNTAAKLNLTDCKIENNTVSERGSGFCLNSGNAALTNCQIKNNRSEYYGGGFFVDFTASVSLNGCTVSGNSAKYGGGAFEMEKDGTKLVLEDTAVTGNSVDAENSGIKKGGGIHFYKGSVTFKGNVTVKDNTCAGAVNNICMRGNTVTFDASEMSKDSVVYVNDGVLNDISGITNENVDALIMENGNHIVLNNGNLTSHTPDYTGEYIDNGDGTHSCKCTVCDKYGTPEAHAFDENGECICGAVISKYIDRRWDEETGKVISEEKNIPEDAKEITADTTELGGGWYVVAGDIEEGTKFIEMATRLEIHGDVNNPTNIILLDGAMLHVKGGIEVNEDCVLNIYGQQNNTGKIIASQYMLEKPIYNITHYNAAGIGGGEGGKGGTITINGGIVIASSRYGAGIGGGKNSSSGKITVNGGIVNAESSFGAGIGGGFDADGGTVIVNGGTVTAESSESAGIGGGGECEKHGTLTVADGMTIKAGNTDETAVIVTAGEYENNRKPYINICVDHGEQYVECAVNVVGGTLKNCTVTLTDTENAENVYNGVIDGVNTYYVDNIANGTYLLTVASDGAVTRTYTVEIDGGAVEKSAELYAEGDVNGDGVVAVNDYLAAVNTALGSETEVAKDLSSTADYQKAVADLDGDGFVDVLDVALLERKIHN